jgi:hypothetical protein
VANRLVQKVQVPALPIPKDSPLKQYLDDLNNILRLFFNLLANAVNNVFGELGGRFYRRAQCVILLHGRSAHSGGRHSAGCYVQSDILGKRVFD